MDDPPTAEKWYKRIKGTGHPVLQNTSALSRGILKRKKGKEPTQMNILFRSVNSVNQLVIYGVVANWC